MERTVRRRIARTPKKTGRRCPSGKTRFRDHESAAAALRFGGTGRVPVRCYLCPACKGWHLTSQP